MGIFSNIGDAISGAAGNIIGTVGGSILNNVMANRRQNDAQAFSEEQTQAAMDFNSAEALKTRQFNEAEAIKQREYEYNLSSTANQRAVEDLRLAGLNPMLALSHGGASTPQGAAASGGQASATPTGAGIATPGNNFDISTAMQQASAIKLQSSQAGRVTAEENLLNAQADEVRARTPTHAVSIEQMQQNIEESKNRIVKIIQDTSTSAHSAANLAQQTLNLQEIIPQIRATVEQLRAHTRLTGAQTTLAGAQTTQTGAQTEQTKATTTHLGQQIQANLPKLEAALKNLERVQRDMAMPGRAMDESVADSFMGALSATLRAINPLQGFIK